MSSIKEKIEKVLLLFLLTDTDLSTIASAISTSMIASASAAYQWAAKTASAVTSWIPPEAQQQAWQDLSQSHAQSIVATYEQDLRGAVQAFCDEYERIHGNLSGQAWKDLETFMRQWCDQRAAWKTQQIADYSTGIGENAGTDGFVDDALGANQDIADQVTDVVLSLWVAVLPNSAATEDICADWAGYMVPFEDKGELPYLPAHLHCPHYLCVIRT